MARGVIPKKIPEFVRNAGKSIKKTHGWKGVTVNASSTRQAYSNLGEVLKMQMGTGRVKHAELTLKEVADPTMPDSEAIYYVNEALHRMGAGKQKFATRAEAIAALQKASKKHKSDFDTELPELAKKFKYVEVDKNGNIVFTNKRRWFRFLRRKQLTIQKETDPKTGKVSVKGFKVKGWF